MVEGQGNFSRGLLQIYTYICKLNHMNYLCKLSHVNCVSWLLRQASGEHQLHELLLLTVLYIVPPLTNHLAIIVPLPPCAQLHACICPPPSTNSFPLSFPSQLYPPPSFTTLYNAHPIPLQQPYCYMVYPHSYHLREDQAYHHHHHSVATFTYSWLSTPYVYTQLSELGWLVIPILPTSPVFKLTHYADINSQGLTTIYSTIHTV